MKEKRKEKEGIRGDKMEKICKGERERRENEDERHRMEWREKE